MKFVLLFFCLTFSSLKSIDFKGYGTKLDILDRQTTKKYEYVIPNGQSIDLGLDSLIIYQCVSIDREMINDQFALIHLFKKKINSSEKNEHTIFLGWIVKSSPSLIVIEHPTYEIKLKECLEYDPLYFEKKLIN